MKKNKGEIILLIASVLWGSCFVFQKMSMDYIGPYTLGFLRFLIGSMMLIPVIYWMDRSQWKKGEKKPETEGGFLDKNLYLGGGLCGMALFAAATFQQIGLQYTTAGKAGFLTSLEIILVALITIIAGKKIQINPVIGVVLAIIGMYLLCMSQGFYLGKGDSYEVAGIVFWAMQILVIDKYAKKVNVIKLSMIQFLTTGFLSGIFMILFETPHLQNIREGMIPILYTGVIEVAVAYTLQIIGQKYTPPIIAAVILSMEAVFASICGVIFLGEIMSVREIIGCIFMFAAIIISQIPERNQLVEKIELNER